MFHNAESPCYCACKVQKVFEEVNCCYLAANAASDPCSKQSGTPNPVCLFSAGMIPLLQQPKPPRKLQVGQLKMWIGLATNFYLSETAKTILLKIFI